MIQEFEKVLAQGGNLASTKTYLIQQAETARIRRIEQIEDDFRVAELIRYGLEQPKASPAFGVAKGVQRWLQKKYPTDNSLARELQKQNWLDQKKRGGLSEGKNNGDSSGVSTDSGRDRSEEILSTPIPEIEP